MFSHWQQIFWRSVLENFSNMSGRTTCFSAPMMAMLENNVIQLEHVWCSDECSFTLPVKLTVEIPAIGLGENYHWKKNIQNIL